MKPRDIGRKVYYAFRTKHAVELAYWRKCYRLDKGDFDNAHYQKLMLAMAEEESDAFLRGKVVADFGCGPRGSLAWIRAAKLKIGIDVLIPEYYQYFGSCMRTHEMMYLTSTERYIPLPDNSVDVIFSINALDHVSDLSQICAELRRILRPGGELIGSFNLNQKPTKAEPQALSEILLDRYLFRGFAVKSRRISAIPPTAYLYQPLIDNKPLPADGKEAVMWVRSIKL